MALSVLRMARPNPTWQESYVRVKKGQRIVIDAEGAWSPDARNRTVWCGGDGISNLTAGDNFPLPGSNVGALIGKIGETIFAIGSRYDNSALDDGVLFLAMNENPNHNNQAGYLYAQIIIFDFDEE